MSDKKLRILFMGSPEVAVPSLKALWESGHSIVGVVSQPDRPAGRGKNLTSPAIALFAKEKNLKLFQPEKIKGNGELLQEIKKLSPDVIVIVAYGRILPKEILELPPLKSINLHFSLLPKYRGAAPMQWALMNGEEETGVTTFFLVEKVDAGPILLQKKIIIEPEDNVEILGHRLANAGAHLLCETITQLESGHLQSLPQNNAEATLAPPLKKEEGWIDWNHKAKSIHNQIRGMNPWPGTFTVYKGKTLKIHKAVEILEKKQKSLNDPKKICGEILGSSLEGLEVSCREGSLLIKEVQMEGKKKMDVSEFLKGHPVSPGERLGS